MNIIIDTHIFLWLVYEPYKVSDKYIEILKSLSNNIYLSSISVAEIMIKKSIGNLDIDFDILKVASDMKLKFLDFDAKSALVLGGLPFFHRDPFDRMIISQAISNNYKVVSVDKKFQKYDCELI